MDFLGFSRSSANRDNFISSLPIFISVIDFSYLIALAKTSRRYYICIDRGECIYIVRFFKKLQMIDILFSKYTQRHYLSLLAKYSIPTKHCERIYTSMLTLVSIGSWAC